MGLSDDAVESTMLGWQGILGLRDWEIRVEVVRETWRKSGDIKIDACNRLAVLMVNESVTPEHLDEVVLHELVHLKLGGLDRMIEDLLDSLHGEDHGDPRRKFAYAQFMDRLEETTQGFTRALLGLAGNPALMVTPSLGREVERERDPG